MASVSQRRGTFKLQCTQCIDRPQYRQSQLRHTTVLTLERIVSTLFPMYVLNLSLSLSLSLPTSFTVHIITPHLKEFSHSQYQLCSLSSPLSLFTVHNLTSHLKTFPPFPVLVMFRRWSSRAIVPCNLSYCKLLKLGSCGFMSTLPHVYMFDNS